MKSNLTEEPLKEYREIPRIWHARPDMLNYDRADESIHFVDGWRNIVEPEIDSQTHKIGALIHDSENDVVTREVIELTPQEIESMQREKVPFSITPTQGRIMLATMGILDQVNAMMEASEDPAMKIYWEYSLSWDRHSEYILSAANLLGMSEEDLNEFFIAASKI